MHIRHLAAPSSRRVIWWIRRDLRLSDNQALQAALQVADEVIPLFILDPVLLTSAWAGPQRTAFLFAGLQALDTDLRRRGGRLVIRQGDPLQVLAEVFAESQAEVLFAEPDVSPYAHRRDGGVEKALPVSWVGSPAFRPPGTVLKSNGEPYTVFTPFSRAWKALPGLDGLERSQSLFAAPERIPDLAGLASLPLPEPLASPAGFPAGEAEAQRRLELFTHPAAGERPLIESYAAGRNRLDLDGTAQLSPYLRFGMLSARQAVAAALRAMDAAPEPDARQGVETWLNELIWREFYLHALDVLPRLRRENYRLPGVHWQNDPQAFQAWCEGRTGYPVVDAAMRQLVQNGWMHNRARMIVASFLTKDLLIDWRWGERFFMQHLVDGDPAANNGGWQWAAGTGMDAAPYFRIFNPVSQGLRHDPQGVYIRRWLPELRRVPLESLHQPWLMSAVEQHAAGCRIGVDYPAPLVDHGAARERALEAYRGG